MVRRAKVLRTNQTRAEDKVWSMLRAKRLAGLKFRRQHVLGRYIADFVCIPARLVIEVDGDSHEDETEESDAKRTAEIQRMGYRVIRFWNSSVLTDTEGSIADAIFDALRGSALSTAEKKRLEEEEYFFLAPLPGPLP